MTTSPGEDADVEASAVGTSRAALAEVWLVECGSSLTEMDLAVLVAFGATPERVARVAGVARRALEAGVPSYEIGSSTPVHALAWRLWARLTGLRPGVRFSEDEVFAWLTAGAGAPGCRVESPFSVWLPLEVADAVDWWNRLPDGWGPLCWAAGLRVNEAVERYGAGTLERAGLVSMAVLRGWRLLPDG